MKKYTQDYDKILPHQNLLDVVQLEELTGNNYSGAMPKLYCSIVDGRFVESDVEDSEYILKFPTEEYDVINENEHFFLWLSSACGIDTSSSALIKSKFGFFLLSKRFDDAKTKVIHLVDLLEKEQRKSINIEILLDIIKDSKSQKEFLKQIIFSNIIGNYDLHAKNIAILHNNKTNSIQLAPAYDIVCTQYFDDFTRSPINVNGKSRDVEIDDIISDFSKYSLINHNEVVSISSDILSSIEKDIPEIDVSFMCCAQNEFVSNFVKERVAKSKGILSKI